MAIPHSPRRSAWISLATTATVGGFSLLAVLVYVADEYPTLQTRAGTLQASVVGLYGVVVILGRWVRMGCARLSRVHSSVPTFLWAGLRGVLPPAGPSFVCTSYILLQFTWFYHKFRV